MRRPETIEERKVACTFPLLWKKCSKCSILFRFEFGYKIIWKIDWFGVYYEDIRYMCSSCAESKEDVIDNLNGKRKVSCS